METKFDLYVKRSKVLFFFFDGKTEMYNNAILYEYILVDKKANLTGAIFAYFLVNF